MIMCLYCKSKTEDEEQKIALKAWITLSLYVAIVHALDSKLLL